MSELLAWSLENIAEQSTPELEEQSIIYSRKPRICFVAHNAYGALAGVNSGHIGGIEWQQSLMARWLAKRGHQVSMICWDEGQPDGEEIGSVKVFKLCRKQAGIKGLRFLWPKWTSLNAAMKRANADVYYYNCGDLGLGQVTMWTRRNGHKCVYSVPSDPDCDYRLPHMFQMRERVIYRYGLEHADAVIVQTQRQQQMLHEGFGIKSTLIPMPCEGFGRDTHASPVSIPSKNASVLWVGRISKEKRFEWLLDIAENCPEMKFEVVGAANTDSGYASALTKRAAGMSNVNMYGRVRHVEIAEYYRRSNILCCTSAYEGFPNTFLEAWSLGIPVVSTFDPDGVITANGLGWVAHDVEGLVTRLRHVVQSPEIWLKASQAAKQYYLSNHTLEMCLPAFERLFLDVAGFRAEPI